MNDSIIYDGFNFKANGLIVENVVHMNIGARDNQIEKRANRTGGVLVQSLGGIKTIPIRGYYIGSSTIDAQNMYDTIAQMINRQQRPLLIPHAGTYRQYIATPGTPIIEEPDGLNKLTFAIDFVVPDGYAEADEETVLVDTTVLTTSASIPLSVLGSEKARPYITLDFEAVGGGTSGTVTLRNAADFIGLSFTRNFVTGDEITIDSDNFQIFINGVLTEPNGRMPVWQPGSGIMYYADTFSSREVNIYGTYKRKDL